MTERGEYSPAMMSVDPFKSMKKIKKNSHSNNQRRFTDKQIKSLEMMFEAEARLEPRKKVQLARELGLQPRQVAIWFQNKRARWKSKQLETEYNILRQNYNNLVSQFESLKKEKQALVSELERLNEAMQKTQEEERQCCGEKEENQRGEPEMHEKGHHGVLYDDDDGCNNNIKREYFGGFEEEADHLMDIVESADSCLTSSDGWESFKLDQTSSNYPWLDLWS